MFPNEIRSYLDKNPQLLQKFLDNWQCGKLLEWNTHLKSMANVGCYLRSDKGEYVMKFVASTRRGEKELRAEMGVLEHLHKRGIPVVRPISTLAGKAFVLEKSLEPSQNLLLFPYARGGVSLPSDPQIKSMGKTLAELQRALIEYQPEGLERRFNFDNKLARVDRRVRETWQWIWPFHEVLEEGAFQELWKKHLAELRGVSRKYSELLSKEVLTHGDFHHDNLRFRAGKVSSILDFDSLIYAPRSMDLGVCFHYLIFSGADKQNLGKYWKLLQDGYEEVREVAEQERELALYLTEVWLWSQVPWLHFYSSDIEGQKEEHTKKFKSVIDGIRELQEIRLNK